MTIPEAEPHTTAVMAMLGAGLPANLGVALGVGPAKNPPYLAIYPDLGDIWSSRLCDDRSAMTIHFMIHSVGAGPEQAQWAFDKARAVMLGEPPVVPGRKAKRMTQTLAIPVTRDESTQPPLYIAIGEFELITQAAA